MIDLSWLDEFISELPKLTLPRKNLIEIAGYPSWENVNSNLLTFYFDETEEHGFGKLFFNSLLDLISDFISKEGIELNLFDSSFKVVREKNRIDILIIGYEEEANNEENYLWAILIENKIRAGLYNDLKKYWMSLKNPDTKIGVVLSLNEFEEKKLSFKHYSQTIRFINITHKQLIEVIKSNLPDYFQDSDDRHLLFLKEYILNIESHYKKHIMDNQYEDKLKDYQKYTPKVREFENFKKSLHAYCVGILYDVMEQNDFLKTSTSRNIRSIHFYHLQEESFTHKSVRFWIYFGNIESGRIGVYFELYGDIIKYGERVRDFLQENDIYNKLNLIKGKRAGKEYYHIAQQDNFNLELANRTLPEALDDLLNQRFFSKKLNLVELVIKQLEELISNEKFK